MYLEDNQGDTIHLPKGRGETELKGGYLGIIGGDQSCVPGGRASAGELFGAVSGEDPRWMRSWGSFPLRVIKQMNRRARRMFPGGLYWYRRGGCGVVPVPVLDRRGPCVNNLIPL